MLRKDPFVTGEYYHIYNRGVDRREICKLPGDYERFMILLYLANSNNSFRLDNIVTKQRKALEDIVLMDRGEPLVSIGAWCLMTNHFHLLIKQEVDGGITKFMRKLSVGYSMYFNIKYQRQGALFGGLFKSRLINEDDTYLRHLFGYIHLNPLDIAYSQWEKVIERNSIEMKKFLLTYPYSSYQDFCGDDRPHSKIINPLAFPAYFETTNNFNDLIENYFALIEGRDF